MPENVTMLDQIIADAIEKAKQEAVRGFIDRYGDHAIHYGFRQYVYSS